MSGIAAILSQGGELPPAAVAPAVTALAHRGPDAQGSWRSPDGRVELGQASLDVVAAGAAERQPLAVADGELVMVSDGTLVDLDEARSELEQHGHRFQGTSAAEVVLALYRRLGVAALDRLRGEYALVIWDGANGLLVAARDRFGARPLFWARLGDRLCLASEAKALFALGVEAAWDHEAVYQQLFVCLEEDRSLFAGVRALPPGHLMVASRHGVQVRKYWDLDYPPGDREPALSDGEFIEQLGDRLDEAVRLRLVPGSPAGVFLSGGVDSSTVLALASRHAAEPVTAFTVTFSEEAYDEASAARASAERHGADFRPLLVTDDDLADHLADAVWHGEMLGLNTHGVARYVQSRSIREAGYKAVLSGEGSDDVLGGYPSAKQDALLAAGRAAAPPSPPRAGGGLEALAGVERTLGFVPSWLRKVAVTRSVFHALLTPSFGGAFARRDPYRVFLDRCDVAGQLAGRDPVIQSLYLWSKAFLAGYALCAERLAMGFSVEERVPFMDHHLFALIRRMPSTLLVRDGKEKWVLRQAARPLIPASTFRRPKHSFAAPPGLVTPGNRLYELMQDLLRSRALAEAPFFDAAAIAALIGQLPAMPPSTRVGLEPVILMAVCVAVLQDRYGL